MSSAICDLIRLEGYRNPHIILIGRKLELLRHDPNNCKALSIKSNRLSYNGLICAKSALPEAIAYNHHKIIARFILVWNECSAQVWFNTKDREEISRDTLSIDPLWLTRAGQIKTLVGYCCHPFK